MTVNLNLIVVCGFAKCGWSMAIDPAAGADPMAVHEAYLEHLDIHDPDGTDCEAPEHWVGVAQAITQCSSCHAAPGQPHTDYCTLPSWAEHDAEVARALAEDGIPGPTAQALTEHNLIGGIYAGQLYTPPEGALYAGDTAEQIAAEQARIDRFMAGGNDA